MREELQTEMQALLNHFWILKRDHMDLYYSIKRHQEELRSFLVRDLGSRLIIHDKFIKLEKIPTLPSSNLGISSFLHPMDYVFLCILLLFLEDKPQGIYFTLTNLIEYTKSTMVSMELSQIPDWKIGRDRKSFKRVIDYLIHLGVIVLKDESKSDFVNDENANALYVSTGLSNYVMKVFNNDIFDYKLENDFTKDEWMYQEEDKGDVRKYKIYRNLLYSPVVFSKSLSESEMDYLKKLRGHMKEEFLSHLGLELEVTRNMALLFDYENNGVSDSFPNNKRIGIITLIVNSKIVEKIKQGEILLDAYEIGKMSFEELYQIIVKEKHESSKYLSNGLKILSDDVFFETVVEYMQSYSFLEKTHEGDFFIYPTVRLFVGEKLESNQNQLDLFGSE